MLSKSVMIDGVKYAPVYQQAPKFIIPEKSTRLLKVISNKLIYQFVYSTWSEYFGKYSYTNTKGSSWWEEDLEETEENKIQAEDD